MDIVELLLEGANAGVVERDPRIRSGNEIQVTHG